jgi:hypothetical protein
MFLDEWKHKPQCTDKECYCADDNVADPVCECGRPGWACVCEELAFERGEIDEM